MKGLETLFVDGLREIYDGENRLVQGPAARHAQSKRSGRGPGKGVGLWPLARTFHEEHDIQVKCTQTP